MHCAHAWPRTPGHNAFPGSTQRKGLIAALQGKVLSMSQDIFDRVKKVTVEELGVKEEEVVEGASFTEDLGADSLDVVELVMALEDEFGIDIPDEEVGNIKTVGDATEYIKKKQG